MRPRRPLNLPRVERPDGVPDDYWTDFCEYTPEELDREVRHYIEHERWLDDVDNLESEEAAARREAERATKISPLQQHFAQFEREHPPPPKDAPYEDQAEWEWRRWEFHYVEVGDERGLAAHREDRERFIRRAVRPMARADEWFKEWKAELLSRPRRSDDDPLPVWPPDDGDAIRPWDLLYVKEDPDEIAEEERLREVVSYRCAAELKAALRGWQRSLPKEAHEVSQLFSTSVRHLTDRVRHAEYGDLRPVQIGGQMHKLRQALDHAQPALDVLDALTGYWWMNPRAHALLARLVADLRDAALDRYAEMRAAYQTLELLVPIVHAERERLKAVRKKRRDILWERVQRRPHRLDNMTEEERDAYIDELLNAPPEETAWRYPPGRPAHHATRRKDAAHRRRALRRARFNRDYYFANRRRFMH